MKYDPWLDTEENRTLVAVCFHWVTRSCSVLAFAAGFLACAGLTALLINDLEPGCETSDTARTLAAGIFIAAGYPIIMLIGGAVAFCWPRVKVVSLIGYAVVCVSLINALLVVFLLKLSPYNLFLPGIPTLFGLAFVLQCRKMKPFSDRIAQITQNQVRGLNMQTREMFRLFGADPDIVICFNYRCRLQLLPTEAFLVHRRKHFHIYVSRAFVITKDEVRSALKDPGAKRLKLLIRHPLEKLSYYFDRKNSDRIKEWLEAAPERAEYEPPQEPAADMA